VSVAAMVMSSLSEQRERDLCVLFAFFGFADGDGWSLDGGVHFETCRRPGVEGERCSCSLHGPGVWLDGRGS
jgi:hypothetical protein